MTCRKCSGSGLLKNNDQCNICFGMGWLENEGQSNLSSHRKEATLSDLRDLLETIVDRMNSILQVSCRVVANNAITESDKIHEEQIGNYNKKINVSVDEMHEEKPDVVFVCSSEDIDESCGIEPVVKRRGRPPRIDKQV